MNPSGSFLPRLLIAGAVPWALVGTLVAQNESLETLIERSQAAMDAKRWDLALELNSRAIEVYGQGHPLRSFGAQFGAIYYRKGLCEMKLKRWQDAMVSFEICYRDFPNKVTGPASGNPFQKLSLLKWGEAAMGAGKWELALSRFAKFSDERDRVLDTFPQGSFYVNVAICHYKSGHIAAGNENLEIAIRNKEVFPTPEVGIVAAFQELVRAAINKRNEQALLDFVAKNRGELIIDPLEMHRYNGVFLKLAGDALAGGMQRSALEVYQFVPFSGFGAASPDIVKLAALALIHEKSGNVRGALAAYRQLEDYYPSSPNRAENLYQLIRVASLLGEADVAREYALRLFGDFPESPRLGELRAEGTDFSAEELAGRPDRPETPGAEVILLPLPKSQGFPLAIDLLQGRKYIEAKTVFENLRKTALNRKPVDEVTVALAAFYESECCRRLGDLNGLIKASAAVPKSPALGGHRLAQLDLNSLWEAFADRKWPELEEAARAKLRVPMSSDLRTQAAYCLGTALENNGKKDEALDAYNMAMTADAGASEEIARQAALSVLRILKADLEIAVKADGNERDASESPKLKEARAVTALYELSLGAGNPLPSDFSEFRKEATR